MSLYDIIQNILDVSENHNLVREVGEGDIYKYLNSSEHQYPCVFLTVSSINDDLNLRNVNCTLFYVDRLTSDESNKILVQSLGLSVLSDIVERIAGDVDTVEYTTFTEKFTDLCGGVYASLSIGYPLDGACSNDFEVRELEVTENGVYDVLGYDRIVVTTNTEFVVPNGTRFWSSEWSILPDNLDFSEVTDFKYMFRECPNLVSIPKIDISKGLDFYAMFAFCRKLNYLPQLDTSNGSDFNSMFNTCESLTTIPELDISNGTDLYFMVYGCKNLVNISFTGSINKTIEFNDCIYLSYNSVKSILTACSNTTNTDSKTLIFNRTLTDQNGELADLIATCNSKGWTISGLTIN